VCRHVRCLLRAWGIGKALTAIDSDLSIAKEIYIKANKGLLLNYQHNENQDAMTIYNESQTFVVRFLENIRSLASWPGSFENSKRNPRRSPLWACILIGLLWTLCVLSRLVI